MENYTSKQAAAYFQVTGETIRQWALEYQGYLSVEANPGKNRMRQFTVDDMKVLSYVATSLASGLNHREIHVGLKNDQHLKIEVLPLEEVKALVLNERENELVLQLQLLTARLEQAEQARDNALAQLGEKQRLEQDNIRLQTRLEMKDEQLQATQRQLEQAQEQIRQLSEKIGELRGKYQD